MSFQWLNEESRKFLSGGYLSEGESPEERIKVVCDTAEEILGVEGYSDKLYEYMSKGWVSLSSPVWANFGKKRGLPISCFGAHVPDSVSGILHTQSEIGVQSKLGGGTAAFFGGVRPRGSDITDNGKTSGSVHFMELFEKMTSVVSQGCYDEETEVLTEEGWKSFSEVVESRNLKVAQVGDNDEVTFVLPTDYMKYEVDENLLHFSDSKNIDLLVTKNHNMVFKYAGKKFTTEGGNKTCTRNVKDEYRVRIAEECPLHADVRFAHSSFSPSGEGMTTLDRLMVAVQADGNIVDQCSDAVKFRFKKDRKKERLEQLLVDEGLDYSYNFYEKDGSHNIYVNFGRKVTKLLSEWVDVNNISLEWANDFLEEVEQWDGSPHKEGVSFAYSSIEESNVDVVQSVASLAGCKSRKTERNREHEGRSTIYSLFVSKGQYFGTTGVKVEEVSYKGNVYCVEVPSHRLIIRRGGHTLVCGNSTRRGYFAAYLPIDHGDIEEFLEIGTEGHPIQAMNTAVTVKDRWLEEMVAGDSDKRRVWGKVLKSRAEVGYPYIFFHDTVQRNRPDVYKDKRMDVNHSQLCAEILLPTTEEETFVCDLASVNLLYYEDWKDTDLIETVVFLLDAVMTEFIRKLEKFRDSEEREDQLTFEYMKRAYTFAVKHRALGLGVLGWASYLQSQMIPFASDEANVKTDSIFKQIREESYKASERLAEMFGEPEVLEGYGRRNTTLMAIAPTTSSAFILGQVSQSIEPPMSNYYIKDLAKLKAEIKNPHLEKLLEEKGHNTKEVWDSIAQNDGSVMHLKFLTDEEKAVFLTFSEIDAYGLINQAAIRQQYLDQTQSLNLMIPVTMSAREINNIVLHAWQMGICTLYYQHSTNAAQQFSRSVCTSCE